MRGAVAGRAGKKRAVPKKALGLGKTEWLGVAVILVAVVALLATTLLYLRPLGRKTIAFETTDVSAVSTGQEIRVAGIAVGKVTDISLEANTVRVEGEIENDTFIGSESRVEVRMLTPVGGYAVTVVPLGERPLGEGEVIPAERVTPPYSIGDVLQAAPRVTEDLEGATVDANIEEVAEALQHNTTSFASMIDGMNSIATVMDHQRDQVERISGLAEEYLQTFNANREMIFDLVREVDQVLTTYNNTSVGFNEAYRLLGDVLMRVMPLEEFYLNHKEEVHAAVDQVRNSLADMNAQFGPAIDRLQQLRSQLEAWLGPDGLAAISGGTVMASDICVPLPGRIC